MEDQILSQLIKSSLSHYDDQNKKYYNFIKTKNINIKISYEHDKDLDAGLITFDNKHEFEYELLGYFDNNAHIWIWAWVLPSIDYTKTILCRDLLNYGLKLEPSTNSAEHYIIKSLLVNSRILLEEYVQLDTYLALISYLLKNKILFIYPRKLYLDESKKNFVIIYYLIKKI
jgi:hypothetical protein